MGTDTGGFSSLPGPRDDAAQTRSQYPFHVFCVHTTFHPPAHRHPHLRPQHRRRSPLRLDPDLLADIQRTDDGAGRCESLFRSAEAYLQMWQLAYAR